MRILFITTLNTPIFREHYFTKNVWKYLKNRNKESFLTTIFVDANIEKPQIRRDNADSFYYKLYIPSLSDYGLLIESIVKVYREVRPMVIHSNMVEGYDVKAAQIMNLKIVLTIHIGGILCPRGGLNGFLMYNDRICNTVIGNVCLRCTSKELPLPAFSYILQKILPNYIKRVLFSYLKGRNVFYLTPFLTYFKQVENSKHKINLLNYATVIVANNYLEDIFHRNGLMNTYLLSHGVETRNHYPFPVIQDKIKFFYLGRIQYAKGIHVMLEAFSKIDKNLYELHIIGSCGKTCLRREMKYFEKIKKMSEGLNVFFYGELPNNNIDMLIKDFHVMIHPAIVMEVYGITISESLSIGRPVLATRCGGAERQIRDYYNGWLISPNSVDSMYDKIGDIIRNPKQIKEMAMNCRIPFEITSYVEELLNLYDNLVRR